jgi:hypothetical protein
VTEAGEHGQSAVAQKIQAAWRQHVRDELCLEAFAVLWLLRKEGVVGAERAADAMDAAFREQPDWRTADLDGLHVRRALAFVLARLGVTDVSATADYILSVADRAGR